MNLQAVKLELMQQLLNTKKEDVLKKVRAIFEQEEEVDFWDELDEEEKAAIDQGLQSIADGKVKSHEQVMSEMKEKYPNLIK